MLLRSSTRHNANACQLLDASVGTDRSRVDRRELQDEADVSSVRGNAFGLKMSDDELRDGIDVMECKCAEWDPASVL